MIYCTKLWPLRFVFWSDDTLYRLGCVDRSNHGNVIFIFNLYLKMLSLIDLVINNKCKLMIGVTNWNSKLHKAYRPRCGCCYVQALAT